MHTILWKKWPTVILELGWFSGWLFVWIKMEENGLIWLRWSYPKRKEDSWRQSMEFEQGVDCWEIASNSNCDLESQLGFLVEKGKINLNFLGVEGKTIP